MLLVDTTPPESAGGHAPLPVMQIGWGYEHLREVLADAAHEEHEDMLEWPSLDSA